MEYKIPNFSVDGMLDILYCFTDRNAISMTVSPSTTAIWLQDNFVKVETSSDAHVGIYTVTIKQKLNINNYFFTATMQVEIMTQCLITNIIPVTPSTFYYDINEFATRVADNSVWT